MRNFALILLVFLFTTSVFAQKRYRGLSIGGVAGVNNSWILNQNNFEILKGCSDPAIQKSELSYNLTPGFRGGLSIGYKFNRNWSFISQAVYTAAGQRYYRSTNTTPCPIYGDVKRNITLGYLHMPFLMKYSTHNRRKAKFYTQFGPQLGVLLNAKESVIISGISHNERFPDEPLTSIRKKIDMFDLGVNLSTGVDIWFNQNMFMNIGAIVSMGLIDMNGPAVKDFQSKNDQSYQKSRNFFGGIEFGFHYFIKKKNRLYGS